MLQPACHLPYRSFSMTWAERLHDRSCLEADRRLNDRKAALFGSATGVVLDLGAGLGTNRKYLTAADKYIALEPQERHLAQLNSLADAVLPAKAEAIPCPNESIDCVISCMTLCSVCDLDQAINEIRRVLRINGRLLLIEHVGASRGSLLRLFQRLLRPFCQTFEHGCRPDRDIGAALRSSKLAMHFHEYFILRLGPPLLRDWIAAVLTKAAYSERTQ